MSPPGSPRLPRPRVAGIGIVRGLALVDEADGPPLVWVQVEATGVLWLGSTELSIAVVLRGLEPGETVRFSGELHVQPSADATISHVVVILRRLERGLTAPLTALLQDAAATGIGSVRARAARVGVSVGTAHSGLRRLVACGLLRREADGWPVTDAGWRYVERPR